MRARTYLIVILMFMLVGLARAGGPETFNNSSISGTYVVTLSGHGQPNPPIEPSGSPIEGLVGTGLLTFDGNGTITTGTIETNVNGDFQKSNEIPAPGMGTGTYSVSPDGSCTISIPQDPFNAVLDLQWNCVVESDEKVDFIGQINPGFYSMIEGTLTRQGQYPGRYKRH
jgi:hypothetical protein